MLRPSIKPIRDFRAIYIALIITILFLASESFAIAISPETIDEKFCRGLEVKAQKVGLTPIIKKQKFSVKNQNIEELIEIAHQVPSANQVILKNLQLRAKRSELTKTEVSIILSNQRNPDIYHCSTQLYSMVFGHGLYTLFQSGTEEQKDRFKNILLDLINRSTEQTASTLHLLFYISSLRNLVDYQFIPEEFNRKIYNLRQDARLIIEEHTFRNYSTKNFRPTKTDYNKYIYEDFALSDPLRQDLKRLVHVLLGVPSGPKLTSRESMFAIIPTNISGQFSSFANLLHQKERRKPSQAF